MRIRLYADIILTNINLVIVCSLLVSCLDFPSGCVKLVVFKRENFSSQKKLHNHGMIVVSALLTHTINTTHTHTHTHTGCWAVGWISGPHPPAGDSGWPGGQSSLLWLHWLCHATWLAGGNVRTLLTELSTLRNTPNCTWGWKIEQ